MTAVAELVMGPIAQAIGWALVHFVWQGALLALVLAILLHTPGLRSPRIRYGLAFACLLAMVALPVATGWAVYTPEPAGLATPLLDTSKTEKPVAATPNKAVTANASETSPKPTFSSGPAPTPVRDFTPTAPSRHEVITAMLRWERIRALLAPYVPACVVLWLLGVFVMGWRNVASWFLTQRLRTQGVEPVPDRIEAIMATLSARLGIRRAVACLQSTLLSVPATIGWLKPVVLLPASSLLGLDASQLEAILAHELAHIRRYDYLANLFQTLAETVLFYHPAVWWVSRQMRLERELCCDDMAVELCANSAVYAGALARVAQLQQTPDYAMAASGGSLLDRIRRLAQSPPRDTRTSRGWVGLAVVLGVVAAVTGPNLTALFAQPSDGPPVARAITFPEWTMGQLMVRPWGSARDANWEAYQPAMGVVNVPEGMEVQLVVDNNAVTDLSPLSYLATQDLQAIDFRRTEIQDDQLAHIEGMELRELNFELTEITNNALQHFDDMTSLEVLSVGRTNVNSEGVPFLRELTELRQLDLNLTGVTDEGLAHLQDLRNLQYLDLWNAEITDQSLQWIGTLGQLQVLGLEGARITDEGLAALAQLHNLEHLVLENTPVSDTGLAYLQSLQNLARINLTGTRITDASAGILRNFRSLNRVSIPLQVSHEFVRNLDGVEFNGTRHLDGQAFEVTVVENGTGKPVSGAHIEVKPRRSQHVSYFPANLWTNESGRAPFHYTHVREADVTVYAEGYTPTNVPWDMRQNSKTTITLEKTQQIGGFVVDEDGNPVADVNLALSIPGKRNYRTDSIGKHGEISLEDGNWQCTHAPADLSALTVTLAHPEYAPTHYEARQMVAAQLKASRQVLVIRRGLELTGSVVDPDGNAIPDASIAELVRGRFDYYVASTNRTQTDADGNFKLANQVPGAMRLKVDAGGYLPLVEDLHIDKDTVPLRFTLNAGAVLRGKVVDQSGKSIEGVQIDTTGRPGSVYIDHEMTDWKSATDAEGRFYWDEAPQEPVELRFQKTGYATLRIKLTASDEEVTIVLYRPLIVTGTVTDAITGELLDNIEVTYTGRPESGNEEGEISYSDRLRLDSNGKYSIELSSIAGNMDVQRVELAFSAKGYTRTKSYKIFVTGGDVTLDVALKPLTPLQGTVVDSGGAPLPNATVYAVEPHSDRVNTVNNEPISSMNRAVVSATTDESGRFRMERPVRSPILLAVASSGYAVVQPDMKEDDPLVLQTSPWGRLELEIPGERTKLRFIGLHRDVDPKSEELLEKASISYTQEYNGDATAAFPQVIPGEYVVRLAPGQTTGTSEIRRVTVNADTDSGLRMDAGNNTVKGRIDVTEILSDAVNLAFSQVMLAPVGAEPDWPEGYDTWTQAKRQAWLAEWRRSDEAKEFRKPYFDNPAYFTKLDEKRGFDLEGIIPGEYDLTVRMMAQSENDRPETSIEPITRKVTILEEGDGNLLDLGTLKPMGPKE